MTPRRASVLLSRYTFRVGFAEPVIGPATSGRTRWLNPPYERARSRKMRTYSKSMNVTLAVGIGLLAAAGGAVLAAKAQEPSMHFYNTPAAAAAQEPLSQAVGVGERLYISV